MYYIHGRFICLFYLTLLLSFACSNLSSFNSPFNKTDKISDILASPSKYSDKTVSIKGKVTDSLIALEVGYFMLSDDTGSIVVEKIVE